MFPPDFSQGKTKNKSGFGWKQSCLLQEIKKKYQTQLAFLFESKKPKSDQKTTEHYF